MGGGKSPVKEKILEILDNKGAVDKEKLVIQVAEELGVAERIVKAVITRLVKSGELKEENGKIKA